MWGKKKTFLTQQWGCKATLCSKYCGSNPLMKETYVPGQKTPVNPYCSVLRGEFSNFSLENLSTQQVNLCMQVTFPFCSCPYLSPNPAGC